MERLWIFFIFFYVSSSYADFSYLSKRSGSDHVLSSSSSDFELDHGDDEPIEEALQNKILIAGDSWAFFPCFFRSLKKVLKDHHSELANDRRCLRTSKLGIQASEWLGSIQDIRVGRYLEKNKRIKYLYLSLGGNDFQNSWNIQMTEEEELKLASSLFLIMQKITQRYLSINPDLKIILSGYDYLALTGKMKFYAKMLKDMGNPSAQQLNEVMIQSTQILYPLVDNKNIFYIHHLGLAHYYDGVPERGLAPQITACPDEISPRDNSLQVGGDCQLPSSPQSMLSWFGFARDEIHLSKKNYYRLMKHTYENLILSIEYGKNLRSIPAK